MSMTLAFADLCIGIMHNNLEQTKLAVQQLNEFTDGVDYGFVINARDLANLAKNFDNESFEYFLLNVDNQTLNRDLWIFLASYFANKYEMSQITKEQILNFINTQMDIHYSDVLKEIKYFTLIRLAMMIEEYDVITEIKLRLET